MIARFSTFQVQPDQIDGFVAALRQAAALGAAKQAGLQSLLLVGDRGTGKEVLVSFWESEAAAQAAEPTYQDALRELGRFIAGPPPVRESFEVLLQE